MAKVGPKVRFKDMKRVTFTLDGKSRRLIERIAKREGTSKAEVVRNAVHYFEDMGDPCGVLKRGKK